MSDKKDLATDGAADELEGTGDVIKGRVRNAVGGATGNTSEQIKGKAEELGGKAKQALGRVKQRSDPNPGVDDA
jgi:uncharacterized protein YjbJ (UPF0337 family)